MPPRPDRKWPIPYVLKATHGSGQNYFVTSAETQIWSLIEHLADVWLKTKHGAEYREWLYRQIAPGLLVEPYIGTIGVLPLDYKFWVFDGRVKYIQVDTDRATRHKRCFFDPNWTRQQFALEYPLETRPLAPPRSLDRMLWAAGRLSDGFSFVRVDFYEHEEAPLFGEMTFYPGSGREPFVPRTADLDLGRLWPLE